ncbi:MAG: thymidylate synthase [Candidatus Paceibacterota bacterium]|jgi:thymidylate synthase
MKPNYKYLWNRTPDKQYKNLLLEILNEGEKDDAQSGVPTISRIAPVSMRFKFENGFPLITERNMNPKTSESLPITVWQQAIAEICAFINGARTLKEFEDYGCYWWKDFLTEKKCTKRGLEPGDNGPGSYGAAFHDFPMPDGETFNQFEFIIRQILENPILKTHFISPWIPYYTFRVTGHKQKVVVCPCHGWIFIRIMNNKLTLNMIQRSGDVPIGVPSNMCQYAALTMMIAQVTKTVPYEYVHSFMDAHIYENQIPAVKTILSREDRIFPIVEMDDSITNLFDFRKEHFVLKEYNPHPGIKGIPVTI